MNLLSVRIVCEACISTAATEPYTQQNHNKLGKHFFLVRLEKTTTNTEPNRTRHVRQRDKKKRRKKSWHLLQMLVLTFISL